MFMKGHVFLCNMNRQTVGTENNIKQYVYNVAIVAASFILNLYY